MNAIILSAGEGTRLRPLTNDRPKPMVYIHDKPVLLHIINHLKKCGINNFIVNLHYKGEVIKKYFKNGSSINVKIKYSYEKKLLGSAGACKKIEKMLTDPFLVYYGDVISRINIKKFIDFYNNNICECVIGLYKVPDPERCGIVIRDKHGKIIKFIEKPSKKELFSNLVNAGIYILRKKILKHIPEGEFFDFGKDLFPLLIEKHNYILYGYLINEYTIDIGTMENYKKCLKDIQKKNNLLNCF